MWCVGGLSGSDRGCAPSARGWKTYLAPVVHATHGMDLAMTSSPLAFLSEALGRAGPSSLPYAHDFKFVIRQQVLDLLAVSRVGGARWAGWCVMVY